MHALDTENDLLPPPLEDTPTGDEAFVFPVSFSQWRLWFLDQLHPGGAAYNMAVSVRLSGRLDAAALEGALREIVRRHETLRTTFAAEDGQPVQAVSASVFLELPLVDLRRHPDPEAEAARLTSGEAGRPFDLARGPLLRARLLRLGGEEHRLLLTVHHIVSDGWSMGVLVREAAALYEAFAAGRPSPLPELPIQYADYTLWQREELQGEALESRLAWWLDHLRGAPPSLELPTDRPRQGQPRELPRGAVFEAVLPQGLSDGVRALARSGKTTLFAVLLAAFEALLARYTGQEDLVVATPVANRQPPETEGLIGFFVNTLALRGDVSGDPTFRELLARVGETLAGAFERQDTPFEPLVERLMPDRGLSLRPLFQVVLALQNAPLPAVELPGLTLEAVDVDNGGAAFDLALDVIERTGGLALRWGYDAGLFDAATVERLHASFRNLLAAAAADPDRRVAELPLLGTEERRQLEEWGGLAAAAAVEEGACLHTRFREQAERTPGAAAVAVAGRPEESLTYAELRARAAQLAARLREMGVGPEVTVALCVERSADLAVGVLGILESGGAYLPLDPDYPSDRLAFLLEDSGALVLVTHRGLEARLPAGARRILDLSENGGTGLVPARAGTSPDSPAYVIYTSGSTGLPKGVVVPHRSVAHHASAWIRLSGLTARDRVLQFASLSFDAAAEELFPTWLGGGCVVLWPEAATSGPAEMMALARREALTMVNLPAPFWHELASEVIRDPAVLPPSIRLVISGSDTASAARLAAWREAVGKAPASPAWLNSYGPTETTVTATVYQPPADGPIPGLGSVPIGRPLPGLTAFVVDPLGEPVPAGVPGELWIGGAGVTRGYLNRPDLTAERFLPDPFSPRPGARLYRTGDLARWLTGGDLEFLGRIDRQVKVRGFRIELGEVENALAALPGVREAAVVAREDRGTKRLAAFVVPEEAGLDPRALRDGLRERLPEPMVPAAFVLLPSLPLTPNGKLDRRALERAPEPEWAGGLEGGETGRPRTPMEEILAGVFAEVLGRPAVGVEDDFFALGGHSLLATQVVSRIRELLRVELPLRRIFEAPTVAALAARIESERSDAPAPPVRAPREPGEVPAPAPLSFAQQRLWLIDRLEPGSPLYNLPAALHVTGPLDEPALEAALGEVVRRHEALRTTFTAGKGVPVQEIHPPGPASLPAVDLSALPVEAREDEAARLAAEEAARPFDLAAGPLLRAAVLRLEPGERRLLFTMHHIVSDGWSVGVLLREVGALYREDAAARRLPELPLQYADFARWQRDWLTGGVLESQLAYWRGQLAGAPPVLELPSDRPRPAVRGVRGAVRAFALPQELQDALARLGRSEGATLFMTLLAGFAALLARYTGRDDLNVGTAVAGRRWPEAERLIGFFVNTLVLRQNLTGDPSFRELLGRVRETALDAHAHQDLPFERLVEDLNPERSLAHTPLFQVMLVLQNAPAEPPALPGLGVEMLPVETGTSRFDLTVSLSAEEGGLAGLLEYSTELFDAETMDRLAGHLVLLLAGAAASPDTRLSELPLLSAAEKAQLLGEWAEAADVSLELTGELLLHRLFEEQVQRCPDAVAVEWLDVSWTYRELDGRAERIAARLRSLVGPETVVALFAERTPARVAAMLGILKAGGAWLPLDPFQPVDRLASLLEDSGTRVMVAEGGLAGLLAVQDITVVELAEETPAPGQSGRLAETRPDNLAYVLYTSGSTGRPKGVQVSHRAVCNFLLRERRALPLSPGDAVMHSGSPAFDVSVAECFVPLAAGARVVLAPPEAHRDTSLLAHTAGEKKVTRVYSVPASLEAMMREDVRSFTTLREVVSGGEAMPVSFLERGLALPRLRIENAYGPTEATVYATRWHGGLAEVSGRSRVPIGRPVAGSRAYVVDAAFQPVPVGIAGELWLGGDGLARGYLGRPELTAERFVPDPFCRTGSPGTRLYRTGDLARRLPDGDLDLLGRIDQQIKIRGIRIELGEVEAVLAEAPGVEESAVLLRDNGSLAACAVGRFDPAALRAWLRQRLPEAMVPADIAAVPALPRLTSGKVDRRALASLFAATGGGAAHEHVPPRTPDEEILAGIWAEVLGEKRAGGEPVGIHDDFFALGGHSLLATQVLARIRGSFGVEVPVAALFSEPTVAGLAALVRKALAGEESGPGSPPPLRPVPHRGRHPLSFSQERLWVLDRLAPGNPVYNIPTAVRLLGPLDAALLESAFAAVVERHEALRTVFRPAEHGDRAEAVVLPRVRVPLHRIDLRSLPPDAREDEALRLAAAEGGWSFDLAAGPLLRTALVETAQEESLLLLDVHHIVADGWSIGVLLREIATLYEGRALPPLELQYGDFALWQRGWLRGEALAARLAWWRRRLDGMPPVLELPTDRPRPAARSPRGGVRPFALTAALSDALEALSRREGATLFMTLLTGLEALLHRLTGQNDLAVGTAIAGRGRLETEGLIGFFVNTLVLRSDLRHDPAPTFTSHLARTREMALGADAHQDLPFERLVEELRPERSLSHTPLFQVFFLLQNTPMPALQLGDVRLRPVPVAPGTTKFDLTISLGRPDHGGLRGGIEFSSDLYDPPTVDRLAAQLARLLAGAVETPEARLADLPLLGEPERAQVLYEWSDTASGHSSGLTLHGLFESRVKQRPEAVALVCPQEGGDTGRLTFAELNRRANRLARHLRSLGVTPERRVGICTERSLDMVTGMLGILKAGGAYVPLDPAHPAERLAGILEDARAEILVAHRGLGEGFGAAVREVVRLDEDAEEIGRCGADDLEPAAAPWNLAYVLFTSGSTGRPKGVQIEHRDVIHRVETSRRLFAAGPDDVWTLFHSYGFDISVWEMWTCWDHGGRLVVVPRFLLESPAAFHAVLAEERVTVLNQTPVALRRLAQAWDERGGGPEELWLRRVLCGGEAFPSEVGRRLLAAGVSAWNIYGPTEITVWATAREVTPEDLDHGTVPIGRPLTDARIRLLDRGMRLVPVGVAGELCIAGADLARGYIGRPELTADRFVPDPVAEPAPPGGARLYRTGDLARWRPDGTLDYLGRIDHQVKVRGHRVELEEIEAVLGSHPAVRQAAALVRKDMPGGEGLVAYVVARQGKEAEPSELRSWLRDRLPDFMVPTAWVAMSALPVTANGKVDRRALPAPAGQEAGESVAVPRDPVEQTLAAIWAGALGLPALGIHDDFFERGGHSLLATQVLSRVRRAFQVEMPLRALFEDPTVAGFAARLRTELAQGSGSGGAAAPPLVRMPHPERIPLSFAQQRLWFLYQLTPGAALYHLFSPVLLEGPLQPGLLAQALGEIVRRHEALRTAFPEVNGEPVQAVAAVGEVPLPVVDLAGLSEEAGEAESLRWIGQEAKRPFDLPQGPPLRALLLRLAPERHLILLGVHHIVCDGWSLRILVREMSALYQAFSRGEPSPLPELPIQFTDFALWQRGWMRGETLDREVEVWRQQLAGAPEVIELPADRPRPAVQTFRGSSLPVAFPASLSAGLGRLAHEEGGTLFMTLLAGLDALLFRLTGQPRIAVGTPIANRNRAEIEDLIGNFANTLVLAAALEPGISFREALARVRESALAAYAHQDLPFEVLVEAVSPRRDLSYNPLFQVLLALHNLPPVETQTASGLTLRTLGAEATTARLDLALDLMETPDGLEGSLEYSTDLFDAATVERLAGHLRALLEGAAADPEARLDELPVLSEAELLQALRDGSGERTEDLAPGLCLHEKFETWARRTPEAVAVACGGERMTYRDLDRKADGLARRLRQLGAGPEVPVGLYLERSVDLVAALLGILKAGAAYVPLDPAYPRQRLAWILESAAVPLLVTKGGLARSLPEHRAVVVDFQESGEDGETREVGEVRTAAGPENLAYVIFTSGSTGGPKGVQITHRSAVHLMATARPGLDFGPADVWTVVHSFAFDFSVWEIWGALAHGGRLVVVPLEVAQSPADFAELLLAEGVTVLNQTPSAVRQLLESGEAAERALRALRLLVVGGEALPRELVPELLKRAGNVWNFYGPTESTVWAAAGPVREQGGEGAMPIGGPLPDNQLLVLDASGQLVPDGVPGELCIAGAGLARGYYRTPGLTAEKFVPHPFPEQPGERLYRTGDLVRRRADADDADIEFLGRIDHQVKVRGFRIELGEIEAVLADHPAVAQAVVTATLGGGGLVAYLVAAAAPALEELRLFAAARLPGYMIPSRFLVLDRLPLTPNGKVDRRALAERSPDEEEGSLVSSAEHVPPRNETELGLVQIWESILPGRRIGIHDDFFELGGHSLLATQVSSRIRTVFQVELPLRALFESPTVARLAREVEALAQAGAGVLAPPIRRVPRQGQDFPLAFAQEWMWFIDRLDPSGSTFNSPVSVRLTGRLDLAALAASLGEVVRRHEALRATFPVVSSGRPVQRIAPALGLAVPLADLSGLPAAARDAEAAALAASAFGRRLDLERGPLVEALALRLAAEPEEHLLLVTVHHILFDGWSGGVLLREVAALYSSFLEGKPSPLPELPIQYADFAVWQREYLQGEALESLLGYWRGKLSGDLPVLELPGARPAGSVTSLESAVQTVELGEPVSGAVRALARREGITLFVALLAGFQALLSRATRQTDVPVGAPIANRNRPEIEGLIGYFTNTLVMRGDLGGDPTFRELLARTRETALGAYAHQDLPFTRLVEELRPDRAASRTPLFQVLFLLQNAPMPSIELPGLTLRPYEAELPLSTFDMALVLTEGEGGLDGAIWYNRELLDSRAVAAFAARYRILLESAMSDPDRRLSDLALMTEEERGQLVAGRPNVPPPPSPAGDLTSHETLHGRFACKVEEDPEAAALVFDGEETSYGDLDERSNRLARHLRRLGVGAEVRVGLCLERKPELVVAILAVLKAGGAYVPLDPAYPRERLSFLLADSGARVLVADRAAAAHLPESSVPTVWLDDDEDEIARQDGGPLDPAEVGVGPTHAAYVIYTSGSTGTPKGVVVPHGNVLRLFDETAGWFRFDERDTWALFHSYAFDFSVWEMWGALLHGGRLAIVPRDAARSPEDFYELLKRERVTVLNQTPSAFGVLAAHVLRMDPGERGGSRRDAGLRDLRWVIFGGEALSLRSLQPWFERFGDRRPRLVNMYGITETTVHVTWRPVAAADVESGSLIGQPIPDLRVYVLDERREPVPAGVPGEMYVGGAGLARGYLGRPELTAERFVPDPFSSPGARLYRTGDLARLLPEGDLEYLGRSDAQVKIRGFRIEPGEIEAALTRHPAVREAVVIAREDEAGDRRLVGYVVPDPRNAQPLLRLLQLEREGRLDNHPTFELPNGLVVFHQQAGVTLGIYREIFEGEVYRRHGIDLPDGACIFDVGANMGLFTLWAGLNVPNAKIFSFEPIPATADVLRANAELYGLDAHVHAAGVADTERTETFTYYPFFSSTSGRFPDAAKDRADIKAHILNEQRVLDGSSGDSSFELWRAEREGALDDWLDAHMKSERVTCRLTTLSTVFQEHSLSSIDLLKIDAERSELDVLAGLSESDWPKVRQLVIEVHDAAIRDQVLEVLHVRGFSTTVEQDVYLAETDLFNIYARREVGRAVRPHAATGSAAGAHTKERSGDGQPPRPEAEIWSSPHRLAEALRSHLHDELPEPFIPAALVILDALPLTAHGKIDRKALPEPSGAHTARLAERPIVEPRTPVERELAEIWKELLKTDRVSIYDNFFELGGHSLLLTQLASRIRNAFQVEVPLRVLFDVRDVEEMTGAIAERQAQAVDPLEMAEMLDELKGLSPEEIRALLEAEG